MVHPTNLVILFQGDHLLISYRARDTFALCTIADVSSLVNISRKNVQCWWPTFSLQETPCQSFTPVTGLRRREEALMKGQDQTQRPQRAGRWCFKNLPACFPDLGLSGEKGPCRPNAQMRAQADQGPLLRLQSAGASEKLEERERVDQRNVYYFPPSAPPGLLDIVSEQANKHIFQLLLIIFLLNI